MHVAVDVRFGFASGIGRYLRSVVPRLATRWPEWRITLLANDAQVADRSWRGGANVSLVRVAARPYTLREQVEIPARVPADADVYWSPNYNVPAALRRPMVVTIHDVMHLRLREYRGSVARRAYARAMYGLMRSRASVIMCDSAFTRSELEAASPRRGGAEPEVVHLGIDDEWRAPVADEAPLAEPYFVYVGHVRPHKNLPTLLRAFDGVRDRLPAARLVLIGDRESARTPDPAVRELAARLGDRLVWAGELSDEALRRHVRHAVALVQPSTYEGFGFPPLEAMAAGTPAIVSRAGSLPEVCGDAALYFNAMDVAALSDAMHRVASSPQLRADLVARGREWVQRFDWDVTTARVADALRRAAGMRHAS